MTTLEQYKKKYANTKGKNKLLTKHNKNLMSEKEQLLQKMQVLEKQHAKALSAVQYELLTLQRQYETLQTNFDLLSIHGVRAMAKELEHLYDITSEV